MSVQGAMPTQVAAVRIFHGTKPEYTLEAGLNVRKPQRAKAGLDW